MWWQKTNGTDKKESLRVWTKTNIAVHKKQVIEWWCVGQNWVTSLCHPPFPGSVALERISSSASSVQRPKRVPCFFAATRMSVSPLERIYGCPFSAPFSCLPMHSTARGFVVVVGQKSFIHKMHPLVDLEIPIRKLLSSSHTNADQIVRVGAGKTLLQVVPYFWQWPGVVGCTYNNKDNPFFESLYGYVTEPPRSIKWISRSSTKKLFSFFAVSRTERRDLKYMIPPLCNWFFSAGQTHTVNIISWTVKIRSAGRLLLTNSDELGSGAADATGTNVTKSTPWSYPWSWETYTSNEWTRILISLCKVDVDWLHNVYHLLSLVIWGVFSIFVVIDKVVFNST